MAEDAKPRDRILLAEDDPVHRRMLQTFFVKWGYQVVAAEDGLEALRILESHDAPPLAVLDWTMPGMEGPDVCQRVRQHPERAYTYIIILTGRDQKEDILCGLESGADDYLAKPFDAGELRARLRVGQRILDLQNGLIVTREELFFRATHDALTGIANRDGALDALHREHARQTREGGSFGIILADLDHFKSVNDKHGHLCGDAVLKEAARRMLSCARPYDTVSRYGGEEFLVIVPSSGALGPFGLAERMRKAMEAQPFVTDAGEVHVTGTFGVAVSSKEAPLDSERLIFLADNALYRAKRYGRNRSELANPVHVPPVAPVAAPESTGRGWRDRMRWGIGASPERQEERMPGRFGAISKVSLTDRRFR
jgi:diguanylate cyclase (GGDEF)-like protein